MTLLTWLGSRSNGSAERLSRLTGNHISCPNHSRDDRLPMLTFTLRCSELQLKKGRRQREREGLRGGVREADTNKGKSQGLECEAVRSDPLNREYNTLDHDGAEDKAPKPNNG